MREWPWVRVTALDWGCGMRWYYRGVYCGLRWPSGDCFARLASMRNGTFGQEADGSDVPSWLACPRLHYGPASRPVSLWLLEGPTHVTKQALPGLAGRESSVASQLLGLLAEPSGRWIDVRMQSHYRNKTANAAHIRKLASCHYSSSPRIWLFSFTGTRCDV